MSADPGAAVADEWMRIARKDWRRAERNLKDRDSEAAGFFLQQSLEKHLKAFLLKHNWKLRKIHELDALLDEAAKFQQDLEMHRDLCERVSGYYMAERYPPLSDFELSVADIKRPEGGARVCEVDVSQGEIIASANIAIIEKTPKEIGVVTFYPGRRSARKVRYDRKEDILTLELSKAAIDHAEEAGPIIAHFSADDRLVLLEILEASDFLAHLTKATKAEGRGSVEL